MKQASESFLRPCHRGRLGASAAVVLVLAVVAGTLVASAADAQTPATPPLAVAGNGRELVVALPTGRDSFELLIHSVGDAPGHLRRGAGLTGRLAPAGLAATTSTLWLVYDDGSVQSIAFVHPADSYGETSGVVLSTASTWPRLPAGAQPRAAAAAANGLWLLVQVQSDTALAQIDARLADGETAQPLAAERRAVDEPRLLQLAGNRWQSRGLPEEWASTERLWLVMPSDQAERPWLVTYTGGLDLLSWFRPAGDDDWLRPIELNFPAPVEPALAVVQGQLVAAQRMRGGPELTVSLSVLRERGAAAIGALKFELEQEPARWWLAPLGQAAAIFVADAAGHQYLAGLDLQGGTTIEPVSMVLKPVSRWAGAQFLVLVMVLAATTICVVVFTRRDPEGSRLELPPHLGIAPLPLRLAAGVFDFTPCMLVTSWLLDVEYNAVWSTQGVDPNNPRQIISVLTVTGIFVAYTTLAEAITARTLGKAVFHLRVTSMRGQDAKLWQILARNLMKACDLLVLPLLILPLLSPYRQRFGDLLARTVVVTPVSAPPARPDSPDRAQKSDDPRSHE